MISIVKPSDVFFLTTPFTAHAASSVSCRAIAVEGHDSIQNSNRYIHSIDFLTRDR